MNKQRCLVLVILVVSLTALTAVGWAASKQNQMELTADEMVLDDANGKVVATGEVILVRSGITLQCQRLTGKQDLDKVEAEGKVVVKQEGSELQSQRLELDYKAETAVLTGSPRLLREQATITGDKFKVDLAADYWEVIGNAHLEEKEQNIVADADKLEYSRKKQEIVLIGNVVVVQNERRITGPKVIVDLEAEKVKVKGRSKLTLPADQGDQNAD